MPIEVGLSAEKTIIADESQSAIEMGSGDLPVFATPAMIALMEGAAALAVQAALDERETTVGIHLDVSHRKATPLGKSVRAHAELIAIDGKVLTFRVQAWDDHQLIGSGTHQRAIVDQYRFMARLEK